MIKSRRMKWSGHVACIGAMRNTYKVLVGKLEGKESLGRLRLRWKHNIKIAFEKLGVRMWTGFMWFRVGTSNMLCTRE
jgi:hypothetical protein